MQNILKDLANMSEMILKFERESSRSKSLTDKAIRYYKELLEIYDKVTVEYFEKNQLFKLISMTESLDVKYYADSSLDMGYERAKNICALLKTYCEKLDRKLLILIDNMDEQISFIAQVGKY